MRRELLSIYGPLSIQSYGLAIVIGIGIFSWLFLRDPQRKRLINTQQYNELLLGAIISAAIGGRLLAVITSPDPFSWYQLLVDGGLSVLGSLILLLCYLPLACAYLGVPTKPTIDLIALYAPLLQSISRLGCFAAGCCYGTETCVGWAVTYTDPLSIAPLHVSLHPTQLYSALLLLGIFALLYIHKNILLSQRTMLEWYLICIGLERYCVDFFRADREWIACVHSASAYQIISLLIIGVGLSGLVIRYVLNKLKGAAHS